MGEHNELSSNRSTMFGSAWWRYFVQLRINEPTLGIIVIGFFLLFVLKVIGVFDFEKVFGPK